MENSDHYGAERRNSSGSVPGRQSSARTKTHEAQYFAKGRVLYGNAVLIVDIYTALPYMIDVHTVVETPTYLNQAKRAGVSGEELDAIAAYIAANPECGDLIPGTGGARKVRFAPMGRGKRGGYRIIHFLRRGRRAGIFARYS